MNQAYSWYQTLKKPSWAPPNWLFGPVWSVLYAIIAVSFGTVFILALTRKVPWVLVVPFALNLVFNFAFSPIQFGLRNNLLAAADVLLVVGTLIWALITVLPYAPWIAYVNIPYLLWAIFAAVLQLTITVLNLRK